MKSHSPIRRRKKLSRAHQNWQKCMRIAYKHSQQLRSVWFRLFTYVRCVAIASKIGPERTDRDNEHLAEWIWAHMSGNNVLARISVEDRPRVAKMFRLIRVSRNTLVSFQGETPDSFKIMLGGIASNWRVMYNKNPLLQRVLGAKMQSSPSKADAVLSPPLSDKNDEQKEQKNPADDLAPFLELKTLSLKRDSEFNTDLLTRVINKASAKKKEIKPSSPKLVSIAEGSSPPKGVKSHIRNSLIKKKRRGSVSKMLPGIAEPVHESDEVKEAPTKSPSASPKRMSRLAGAVRAVSLFKGSPKRRSSRLNVRRNSNEKRESILNKPIHIPSTVKPTSEQHTARTMRPRASVVGEMLYRDGYNFVDGGGIDGTYSLKSKKRQSILDHVMSQEQNTDNLQPQLNKSASSSPKKRQSSVFNPATLWKVKAMGKRVRTLKPGDSFDSLCLFSEDFKSTSSVVTECECEFLLITPTELEKVIQLRTRQKLRSKVLTLESIGTFASASYSVRLRLSNVLKIRRFTHNTRLTRVDKESGKEFVYFIVNGRVDVIVPKENRTLTVRNHGSMVNDLGFFRAIQGASEVRKEWLRYMKCEFEPNQSLRNLGLEFRCNGSCEFIRFYWADFITICNTPLTRKIFRLIKGQMDQLEHYLSFLSGRGPHTHAKILAAQSHSVILANTPQSTSSRRNRSKSDSSSRSAASTKKTNSSTMSMLSPKFSFSLMTTKDDSESFTQTFEHIPSQKTLDGVVMGHENIRDAFVRAGERVATPDHIRRFIKERESESIFPMVGLNTVRSTNMLEFQREIHCLPESGNVLAFR